MVSEVMLQLLVALPDAESTALAAKELAPTAVGTPVIVPVELLRLRPAGREPVTEKV